MTMHRFNATRPASSGELAPRNSVSAWLDLGKVVYGWTDRRISALDRAWWKQSHDPAAPAVAPPEAMTAAAIDHLAQLSFLHDIHIPTFARQPLLPAHELSAGEKRV